MRFLSIAVFACLFLSLAGCMTNRQDIKYISELTITPDKLTEQDLIKCFNVYLDLKRKTPAGVKTIPLPPLVMTYATKGAAIISLNFEGADIKYSLAIKEKNKDYDIFLFKLDINDGQVTHREEREITVLQDDKIVKSTAPQKKKTVPEIVKESPEELQRKIQNRIFTIKINDDKFNPSEALLEWHFSYHSPLLKNQYLNLHFDICDRLTNKIIDSFDNKITQDIKTGTFNLLITVKAPNSEIFFTSPDSNSTYQSTLTNIILVNQRIKTLRNIEIKIGEKTVLARLEPIPTQSITQPEYYFKDLSLSSAQRLSGREKALNYDICITPEIKTEAAPQ